MNHLAACTLLKNRYFVMRHGESKANDEDKIISHETDAISAKYGLTRLGRRQTILAIKNSVLTGETIVYSSDYSRTKETAEIVHEVLGTTNPHLTPALRERYFGKWERTSTANYKSVWQDDFEEKHSGQVESPDDILDRTTMLIIELEKKYKNKDILLISHGDTLQILQCGFQKVSPYQHRTLKHLEVAEIRQMILKKQV